MISVNLLPKTMRRRPEPGWWRMAAVAFPLAAVGVMGALQLGAISAENVLTQSRDELQLEVNALNRYVRDQRALERQQEALKAVVAIDTTLRQDAVAWSRELAAFAENLPRATSGRPGAVVALSQLSLARVDAAKAGQYAQSGVYDGKNVVSELSLAGSAPSLAGLTSFVRAYEASPDFGIQFSQASRNPETGTYGFTAVVGVVGPAPAAATGTPASAPAEPEGGVR